MNDTIKWLVSDLPQSVRTLFAVLMIAITVLSTTTVFFYKKTTEVIENNTAKIEKMQTTFEHYKDSSTKIIYEMSMQNKTDAVKNLQEIIDQQKELIEQQKQKNKLQQTKKVKNNAIIKANYDKISSLK